MLLVVHDGHPQQRRQCLHVNGVAVEQSPLEGHAHVALARALGLDLPAGAAQELVALDLQRAADHDGLVDWSTDDVSAVNLKPL